MNIENFISVTRDIMRTDSGISSDVQRLEQTVWLLFLKAYDEKERDWEFYDPSYTSLIPEDCRWRNWATDRKDGRARTGEDLLAFVDGRLFPALKKLPVTTRTPRRQAIVRDVFADLNQYMKDGIALRKLVNCVDELDFSERAEKHLLGDVYEKMLNKLQAAGSAGEFYTPRAVTDFIVQQIAPRLGERMADFACGTGGFLTSVLNALAPQIRTVEDRETYNASVYGIEKKPLPYLLGVTNLLLHDMDSPHIREGNAFDRDVRDYTDEDGFDIILMNPPYGGAENDSVKGYFPLELRSSETAELFLVLAMYRLRRGGRAALVVSDGVLNGTGASQIATKKKLLTEYNLHTVLRLPPSVFAPYTSIATNILFFDATGPTDTTWFYRVDKPADIKHFSKTKPMRPEHFADCAAWWTERREIRDPEGDSWQARAVTAAEIAAGNYVLNYCGYPVQADEVLSPEETLRNYETERERLQTRIDDLLARIRAELGDM
ncbi:MAG: type I restriction-modification system subunit M [Veillonellaceae bacterium]|nr:type I restriction-modification system subunit M [Veillonellaceae bacterium]